MALNNTTYHDSGSLLDAFHEGESIGPAMSLMNGGIPYKDFVSPHGIIQDPLRSLIAFKLFTRSIGAARTLDKIITTVCFLLLFAFLVILYKGRELPVDLTLIVLIGAISARSLIIMSRDLLTYAFLLTGAVLLRGEDESETRLPAAKCVALVLFSFFPLAALMYSVDRGVYLTATYFVMLPLVIFCFGRRLLYLTLPLAVLGVGAAVLFAGALLHWEWLPFIDYAIMTVPRYWDLMYGSVYPFQSPRYLLVVLIISCNAYCVFAGFLTAFQRSKPDLSTLGAFRAVLRKRLIDICLLVMSLCYFHNALGRCDWEHIRYSCTIAYVLSCYLIAKYWLHGASERNPDRAKILGNCAAFILIIGSLAGGYRMGRLHLLERDFPLGVPDSDFIPSDYKEGLSFLRTHLSKDDEFFTLTSEASWYYMLNRPCPSRFSIVLLAAPPSYQREVVQDLKSHRVEIILYADHNEFSNLDGINLSERLPLVYAYVWDNYRPYTSVAGMEFWIRKSLGN